MFQIELRRPPAAVLTPAPAAPAAGIASSLPEDFKVPAAPLLDAAMMDSRVTAIRQHEIGQKQCRWIVADEDTGADALMCGAPVLRHRPFCPDHCARAYLKLGPEEAAQAENEMIPVEDLEEEEKAPE